MRRFDQSSAIRSTLALSSSKPSTRKNHGLYGDRHTDSLVRACVEHYSQKHPEQPIYRIEGDYMNLGGLNKIMPRDTADSVLRVMAQMLRQQMKALGSVCAVRHGGDEISLYLVPRAGIGADSIRESIDTVQKQMQKFILDAGLSAVSHHKKDTITGEQKPAGVGLGVGLVDIRGKTKVQQSLAIEEGIGHSKKAFYQALRVAEKGDLKTGRIDNVKVVLADSRCRRFLYQAEGVSPLDLGKKYQGSSPQEAEQNRLFAALQAVGPSPDPTLLEMATVFAAKRDHVTDLPMFGAMDQQQAAYFKQQYGTRARLLHFDYNNLGGGNILGSWVGDAMSRVFADSIRQGMRDQGMDAYLPYLASQGGGKFALLLPPQVEKKKIVSLMNAVDARFDWNAKLALYLSPDEKAATRPIMEGIAKARMKERVGEMAEEGQARALRLPKGGALKLDPDAISIAEIDNLKSRRMGCRLVTNGVDVNLEVQTVAQAMKQLEGKAEVGQTAVAGFEARKTKALHPTSKKIGDVVLQDDWKTLAVQTKNAAKQAQGNKKKSWRAKIGEPTEGKTRGIIALDKSDSPTR